MLTDSWLKTNNGKSREKTEVITDRDSLSVRISPKGKIVFQFRYRFAGSAKRLDLGTYPHLSLKEARSLVQEYKKEIDAGRDPYQIKLKSEADYISQPTVSEICVKYFDTVAVNKVATKDDKRAFEIHIYPKLGNRICDDVSLQEWSSILFKITKTAKTVAEKILGNLRKIMRWGCVIGLLKNQTVQNLKASDLNLKKNVGTRFLSEQEIYWVVHSVLHSSHMSPKNKALILLLLLFGCRVSELRLAKKSDFDFENHIWTIPPTQHKTGGKSGKAIVRPLIPEIEEFLKQVFELSPDDCEYAFPNIKGQKYTLLKKGFQTTIPFYVTGLVQKTFGIEIEEWSTHDLRRTMRTHISDLAPPHICEIMLGHSLPKIWGTYDKHAYLDQQAEAYKKWFDKFCQILNNHERFDNNGSISKASSNPVFSSQFATALIP